MTTDDPNNSGYETQLEAITKGADIRRTLELFDKLPATTVDDMIGEWHGSGLETGHAFDGLLERYGWYGKRFGGPEDVDPLLFVDSARSKFALNPTMMPISLIETNPKVARNAAMGTLFKTAGKLLATNKPQARLRMTEYRGVVTATMIYDRLPINGIFRKVSDDIRLGAMDIRGSDQPFMFVPKKA